MNLLATALIWLALVAVWRSFARGVRARIARAAGRDLALDDVQGFLFYDRLARRFTLRGFFGMAP